MAPFDKITIDFCRSRRRLHDSDLILTKNHNIWPKIQKIFQKSRKIPKNQWISMDFHCGATVEPLFRCICPCFLGCKEAFIHTHTHILATTAILACIKGHVPYMCIVAGLPHIWRTTMCMCLLYTVDGIYFANIYLPILGDFWSVFN